MKQSEIREKINDPAGPNETRTEEQAGELSTLTAEGMAIEPEIRAAIVASPDPDESETVRNRRCRRHRELAQLTKNCPDVGDILRIVRSVFEHSAIDRRRSGRATESTTAWASHQVPLVHAAG